LKIREATISDIPKMTELWAEIMKYHEGDNPYFVLIENYKELVPPMLEKRLNNSNEHVFLYEENTDLAGMIMLRTEDLPPILPFKKRGYIAETIVSSNYRSKGIGEVLVNKAKDYFKSQKCDVMELQVSSKNPAGKKFWERMGFEMSTIHMLSVID